MNVTIQPTKLKGIVHAIPSKSQAHRLLICAAFSDKETIIHCPQINQDIEATAVCLRALGAGVLRSEGNYIISPIKQFPEKALLPCKESGSTLRFLLPIAGAMGVDATFCMEGRLSKRPLSPLWEEMERMGCNLSRPSDSTIRCTGRLNPGAYSISGSVSSQFITGLLFAMALMDGESKLIITDTLESKPYVDLTRAALKQFCVDASTFSVSGSYPFHSPGIVNVEGDWSNGAFFLAAQAIGNPVSVSGLDPNSAQGDRIIIDIIASLDTYQIVNATDIPDLVPILSVVAASKKGCQFTGIHRLRIKESDRVASIMNMLRNLGIFTEATQNTLTIYPGKFLGGSIDAVNDHRIAMSAAIAATAANGPVTILGAECVAKSYPAFWDVYGSLGGIYEQYIR